MSNRVFALCPPIRVALVGVVSAILCIGGATAQPALQSERGTLLRGTTYEIRMPSSWNKVLISDLDFAQTPDAPRYTAMLRAGYAVAGTRAVLTDRPTTIPHARSTTLST